MTQESVEPGHEAVHGKDGLGREEALAEGPLWGIRSEAAKSPFLVGMDALANCHNLLFTCATQR